MHAADQQSFDNASVCDCKWTNNNRGNNKISNNNSNIYLLVNWLIIIKSIIYSYNELMHLGDKGGIYQLLRWCQRLHWWRHILWLHDEAGLEVVTAVNQSCVIAVAIKQLRGQPLRQDCYSFPSNFSWCLLLMSIGAFMILDCKHACGYYCFCYY